MSPEKRSALMARIKGKDTLPEKLLASAFAGISLRWESHAKDLPGRPDFVFRTVKVAVFVDGDFWHGWRFPEWRDKLSPAWEEKIEKNRARDRRTHRKLRRMGWKVIRIWEHQVHGNLEKAIRRVLAAFGYGQGMEQA